MADRPSAFRLCTEHVRRLEGESPLDNLMEVKSGGVTGISLRAVPCMGPDGKKIETPPGVRNTSKSIYKIAMTAEGFKGRDK